MHPLHACSVRPVRQRCNSCNEDKERSGYDVNNWKRAEGEERRLCLRCSSVTTPKIKRVKGNWTCQMTKCRRQLPRSCFSLAIAKYGESVTGYSRRCDSCLQALQEAESASFRENMQHVQKHTR